MNSAELILEDHSKRISKVERDFSLFKETRAKTCPTKEEIATKRSQRWNTILHLCEIITLIATLISVRS